MPLPCCHEHLWAFALLFSLPGTFLHLENPCCHPPGPAQRSLSFKAVSSEASPGFAFSRPGLWEPEFCPHQREVHAGRPLPGQPPNPRPPRRGCCSPSLSNTGLGGPGNFLPLCTSMWTFVCRFNGSACQALDSSLFKKKLLYAL